VLILGEVRDANASTMALHSVLRAQVPFLQLDKGTDFAVEHGADRLVPTGVRLGSLANIIYCELPRAIED